MVCSVLIQHTNDHKNSNGQQCELWTLHIFQFLSAILEYNVSDSLNSNTLGFYHNCLYHLECAIVGIDQLAKFFNVQIHICMH